jgi:3'5'-cyclic nucleotide phosphodiesterase
MIKSERFKLYGEIGVQERYHFAESWKVVEQVGLLEGNNRKSLFRECMMEVILATDMSNHVNSIA